MKIRLFLVPLLAASMACAQTTTPNLNLNLPSNGTPNWGALLNANFSSLDSFLSGGTLLPANFYRTVAAQSGGLAGSVLNWRGNWVALTAYAHGDAFINSGTSYMVITAYTSGGTFGATDTTNAVVISTGLSTSGGTITGDLAVTGTAAAGTTDLTNGPLVEELANNTASGATLHKLVCAGNVSGAPQAQTCTTTSTNWSGVAVGGATGSTGGNTMVARSGQVVCVFDGTTVFGDYVAISTTVAGDCHDIGYATYPVGGTVVGRVWGVNSGAGTTATMNLYSPGIKAPISALITYISRLPPQTSFNLFDPTAATTGSFFNGLTGTTGVSSSFFYTGKIPVFPGGVVKANFSIGSTVVGYGFWDPDGVFIAGANGVTSANTNITVPANAIYFQAGAPGSVLPSNAMVVAGPVTATMPGSYVPYASTATSAATPSTPVLRDTNGDFATHQINLSIDPSTNLQASTKQYVDKVGPATAAYVSSLSSTANEFDTSKATTGAYFNGANCTINTFANFFATGKIPVIGGGTVKANFTIGSTVVGYAFWNANGECIPGANGTTAANTNISVPSNALYFQAGAPGAAVPGTAMVVASSTMPGSYVAFAALGGGSGGSSATEASVSNTNGLKLAKEGDSITHAFSGTWEPVLLTRLGLTDTGFLNARSGRRTADQQEYYGGFYPNASLNGAATAWSVTNTSGTPHLTLTGTSAFPIAYPAGTPWYQVVGVSASAGAKALEMLMCIADAGATTSSLSGTCTYGGVPWVQADITSTSDAVTVVPTFGNGTVSNCSWVDSTSTVTIVATLPIAFPAGTQVGFTGLTACSFLVTNPAGGPSSVMCTLNSGATTTGFSAVCATNGAPTTNGSDVSPVSDSGTIVTPGHNYKCVYFGVSHNFCNGGTAGNTFAQDLLVGNPDIYLIGLGTNDSGYAAGTTSDLPGAATESGAAKAVIEFALRAKPSLRVMWWLPYLQSTSAIGTTLKAVLNSYGIPAFDARVGAPMDNLITWPTYLLSDHTHPSTAGGLVLGSYLASQVKPIF